jgi:glycosyltransferase involved in cell wall biosynthesis
MTSHKKRVLVLGPHAESTGGIVTFQRNLMHVSNLNKNWEFVPYNISRPPKKREANHNYDAIFQQDPTRLFKATGVTGRNFFQYFRALQNIDLVQIQSSDYYSFWESAYYAVMAKQKGVPVVVRYGGAFDNFYGGSNSKIQKMIRWILRQPDGIVVQSQSWKEYFGKIVDPQKLHVIGNAIPHQAPIDRSERTNTQKPKFLFFCGQEAKRKGYFELIEAIETCEGRLELQILAANDDVRADIKKRTMTSKEIDVLLMDSFSREELKSRIYPEADVFLIPSHGEGFPNSMLEAMGASLPIIATPVGAIPEVLEEGKEGFIVELGNIEALKTSIQKLAQDHSLRLQMGAESYRTAMEQYEINTMFSRFDRLWTTVLNNR